MKVPRALLTNNNNEIKVDMIYNPRSLDWEFVMSYDFYNHNDLEIIEFKTSRNAAKNLGKALDKKLRL